MKNQRNEKGVRHGYWELQTMTVRNLYLVGDHILKGKISAYGNSSIKMVDYLKNNFHYESI